MINITGQIRPNLSEFGPGPNLDYLGLISPIICNKKCTLSSALDFG
jgi:hypothetical protein